MFGLRPTPVFPRALHHIATPKADLNLIEKRLKDLIDEQERRR